MNLRREIEQEISEACSLICESCTTIVIEPGHCDQCARYWQDVKEGLWRDE